MQVGGAPLDEGKTYRVAVLDFLARGGDDYTMFRDAQRITPDNDAPLMVNEVVEYLRKLGTARRIEGGREGPGLACPLRGKGIALTPHRPLVRDHLAVVRQRCRARRASPRP